MKIVNCIIIIPFVFGIVCFESGVSCNPTGDASDHSEVELIDVDLNNLNIDEVNTVTFKDNPEAIIVNPKDKKRMKIIRIGDEIVWELTHTSRCLNLAKFMGKQGKMYIMLNTIYKCTNIQTYLIYDPNISSNEANEGNENNGDNLGNEGTDIETNDTKLTQMGFIPFLIELNTEFGRYNEYKSEIWGSELNINDIFDRWYFKYSTRLLNVCGNSAKTSLNYEIFESNEWDRFLKITDDTRTIWIADEGTDNTPCKRVEVFKEYNDYKMLRLTMSNGHKIHFKHDPKDNLWTNCEKAEFEQWHTQLGLEEADFGAPESRTAGASNTNVDIIVDKGESTADTADTQSKIVSTDSELADKATGMENTSTDESETCGNSTGSGTNLRREDTETGQNVKKSPGNAIKSAHTAATNTKTTSGAKNATVDTGMNTVDIESLFEDPQRRQLDLSYENSHRFRIAKQRLSLLKTLTLAPRGRAWVDELAFRSQRFSHVHSDCFGLTATKVRNESYFLEVLVRDRDRNYFSLYFERFVDEDVWICYLQSAFYQYVAAYLTEFEFHSALAFVVFGLIDELNLLAAAAAPSAATTTTNTTTTRASVAGSATSTTSSSNRSSYTATWDNTTCTDNTSATSPETANQPTSTNTSTSNGTKTTEKAPENQPKGSATTFDNKSKETSDNKDTDTDSNTPTTDPSCPNTPSHSDPSRHFEPIVTLVPSSPETRKRYLTIFFPHTARISADGTHILYTLKN